MAAEDAPARMALIAAEGFDRGVEEIGSVQERAPVPAAPAAAVAVGGVVGELALAGAAGVVGAAGEGAAGETRAAAGDEPARPRCTRMICAVRRHKRGSAATDRGAAGSGQAAAPRSAPRPARHVRLLAAVDPEAERATGRTGMVMRASSYPTDSRAPRRAAPATPAAGPVIIVSSGWSRSQGRRS